MYFQIFSLFTFQSMSIEHKQCNSNIEPEWHCDKSSQATTATNNATDRQLEKFIWIPYCINNLVSFPFRCLFLVRIIFLPFFAICLICHVKSETLSLKQVDLWPFSRDLLALAMQVAYICVCGSYLLCQDFMLMLFLDFVAKDRRPIGNRFLNSKKWIGNLIFFHFATIWIECVFT